MITTTTRQSKHSKNNSSCQHLNHPSLLRILNNQSQRETVPRHLRTLDNPFNIAFPSPILSPSPSMFFHFFFHKKTNFEEREARFSREIHLHIASLLPWHNMTGLTFATKFMVGRKKWYEYANSPREPVILKAGSSRVSDRSEMVRYESQDVRTAIILVDTRLRRRRRRVWESATIAGRHSRGKYIFRAGKYRGECR